MEEAADDDAGVEVTGAEATEADVDVVVGEEVEVTDEKGEGAGVSTLLSAR